MLAVLSDDVIRVGNREVPDGVLAAAATDPVDGSVVTEQLDLVPTRTTAHPIGAGLSSNGVVAASADKEVLVLENVLVHSIRAR